MPSFLIVDGADRLELIGPVSSGEATEVSLLKESSGNVVLNTTLGSDIT